MGHHHRVGRADGHRSLEGAALARGLRAGASLSARPHVHRHKGQKMSSTGKADAGRGHDMSYNEAPEEYERPGKNGFMVIDDPWPMARQENSIYPDIDQMLSDVGPATDAFLDQKLKEWFE